MSFTPKKLSPTEFALQEQEFSGILEDVSKREAAWAEMHAYFIEHITDAETFKTSYWRWYVELTWRQFNRVPFTDLITIVIPRQIPIALQLQFDPWEKIIWYLGTVIELQDEAEDAYGQIREAFLNSEGVVGMRGPVQVLIRDVVADIRRFESIGVTAIERAEYLAKIRQFFVPKTPEEGEFIIENPDVVLDKFIGLINFFLGIQPDRVWYVIEEFIRPSLYENIEQRTSVQETPSIEEETSSVQEETTKLSYADIQKMIDSRFTKDASLQYQNIEGVLSLLENMAREYQDPKITELYYFDEEKGVFRWSEDVSSLPV